MPLRTVSLEDWLSSDPQRKANFIQELGLGLEELGFVAVSEPGLDTDLLQSAYDVAEQAFALPAEEKCRSERAAQGRQRGYTPFGIERAKDRKTADLKEFWHIGRVLPSAHPRAGSLPDNAFPEAVPAFETTFMALFEAMETLGDHLLEAVTSYLGLKAGTLTAMTADAPSVLRVIHYPPLAADTPAGAVRAAAHEDINLMTVLPVSTAAGLELLTRDGDWVAVDPAPGTVIVDTGDMMALLTSGRLPATTHRVVNPADPTLAKRSRYSMPFFIHPRLEVPLHPFDGSKKGPTTGEFFQQRMVATGVASAD